MHKTYYQRYLSCFIRGAFNVLNPGADLHWNWHLSLIAEYLEHVTTGRIKRLIINMPPRALKSTCISICWPAWLLGHNPATRIICASYSQKLSEKFSIETRNLIQSPFFNSIFSDVKIAADQNQRAKFLTDKRGFRLATSINGALTGEGGDFLILDDPHNASQIYSVKRREAAISWFLQSFSTRLDNKKEGRIIVVMQRLHEHDLTGVLLSANSWEVLKIPAFSEGVHKYYINSTEKIFCENEFLHKDREDIAEIERAKGDLGAQMFSAQYLQQPLLADSGMIKKDWIQLYSKEMLLEDFDCVMQSWDTGIKSTDQNSYTVGTTWGMHDKNHYLLDVYRDRLEYPELKRAVLSMASKFDVDKILIEDKASGQSLIQDLRREHPHLPIVAVQVGKDKVTRFSRVTPIFENRRVFVDKNASWRIDYEKELLSFPHGAHADQVDSTSQYLNFITQYRGSGWQVRKL